MRYRIDLWKSVSYEVEVEAASEEEAIREAKAMVEEKPEAYQTNEDLGIMDCIFIEELEDEEGK
jgi:hypothetical protein